MRITIQKAIVVLSLPADDHGTEYGGPPWVDDIVGVVVFDWYVHPQWGQHQKYSYDGGGEPDLGLDGPEQQHGHPRQEGQGREVTQAGSDRGGNVVRVYFDFSWDQNYKDHESTCKKNSIS